MAQTVSDKELQDKRDRVAKLREQIANETDKASVRQREQENAIEAAQLEAEEARLELQLHKAKEAAKVTTVKDATAPLVASAKEQMRMAEAQLAAAKGDGGPGAKPDPTPEELEAQKKEAAESAASSSTSSPSTAASTATTDKDKG